jgi:hypothetical protein
MAQTATPMIGARHVHYDPAIFAGPHPCGADNI